MLGNVYHVKWYQVLCSFNDKYDRIFWPNKI